MTPVYMFHFIKKGNFGLAEMLKYVRSHLPGYGSMFLGFLIGTEKQCSPWHSPSTYS